MAASYMAVIARESADNWPACLSASAWGLTRTALHRAAAIKEGDVVWCYVGGAGVVGVAEVAGPPRTLRDPLRSPWRDGRLYPAVLPLKNMTCLAAPIALQFPARTGFKVDTRFGINTNQLMSGLFRLTAVQHHRLVVAADCLTSS